MRLNQLPLPRDDGFKFLNAFGFSSKNEIMLLARQALQVLWSVVAWNTIQVMNNPAFWKGLVMSLFPNNNMFKHIACPICPWVVKSTNLKITSSRIYPAPLPVGIAFPFLFTLQIFIPTWSTSWCRYNARCAAITTTMPERPLLCCSLYPIPFQCAGRASFSVMPARLATYNTPMVVNLSDTPHNTHYTRLPTTLQGLKSEAVRVTITEVV